MPVTIRHVAREVGVSVSTVSRALNGGAAGDETAARVRRAAERLGYVPNATARKLVRSRTDAVGVVLPFLTGEFYPEVVRGLDRAVQENGRHLVLSTSHNTAADTVKVLRTMHGLVDGLVVMTPAVSPAEVSEALVPGLPTVLLNAPPGGHAFDVLSTDGAGGARLAVEHLADRGHRRIAVLAGEVGNHDAEVRLGAWRRVLAERGLAAPEAWVLRGDFSQESGVAAGRRLAALVRETGGPTAAFASSDYMAVGAIHALAEAGLAVPGDVSVVGFDDVPSAAYLNPPLTTVRAHAVDLGVRAARWLADRVDGDGTGGPRRETLPAELVVRATTAPPRA